MDQNRLRAFATVRAALALILSLIAGSAVPESARAAEPIRIYAAGSLGTVMPQLVAAAGLSADAVAPPVFGPAGVLRERLVKGEHADIFASADLAQPEAVVAAGNGLVVPFARNRMCVVAPQKLGLSRETLLDRLLSPQFRLAASTPGADPGGDYALAVFARADALRPGAAAALKAKTLLLLGGPGSMTPQPGHSPAATIFLGDHADGLLYYCSGTEATAREVPGLVSIPVPDALEVGPVYGLALLSDRPDAQRLALFIVSEHGQRILAAAGLLPLVANP